jgi:DNA topoisomerase IB
MGVAVYFLDKLALRAGHEKDDDEADTVGCCTLKVRCWSHFGWSQAFLIWCRRDLQRSSQ